MTSRRAAWALWLLASCQSPESTTSSTGSAATGDAATSSTAAAPTGDNSTVRCRARKSIRQCAVTGRLTPFVLRELQKNDLLSRSTLVLDAAASSPESLAGLPELGGAVIALELSTAEGAEVDLSPLAKLPSLKSLSIDLGKRSYFRSAGGLAVISKLGSLTDLTLSIDRLEGLEFLGSLDKLEVLTITGGSVESLDGLEGRSALRKLRVHGVGERALAQLSKLASLRSLEDLALQIEGRRCDLGWLPDLAQLVSFSVSAHRCSTAGDAAILARVPKLEKLRVQGLKLLTVAPLADAPALTSLMLESTGGLSDVSALAKATTLRRLYLSEASLADLSILEPLTQLERLEIYSNQMPQKVESLGKLTQLKELGLYIFAKQSVRDLPFLQALPSLQRIAIHGDYVKSWRKNELGSQFPQLKFVEDLPE